MEINMRLGDAASKGSYSIQDGRVYLPVGLTSSILVNPFTLSPEEGFVAFSHDPMDEVIALGPMTGAQEENSRILTNLLYLLSTRNFQNLQRAFQAVNGSVNIIVNYDRTLETATSDERTTMALMKQLVLEWAGKIAAYRLEEVDQTEIINAHAIEEALAHLHEGLNKYRGLKSGGDPVNEAEVTKEFFSKDTTREILEKCVRTHLVK